MWDRSCDFADGGGGGGTGALVQWQGTVANAAATSESEESSVSGSDPLSDKAMRCVLDMVCFLVRLGKTRCFCVLSYLSCSLTICCSWQKLFLSKKPELNDL